MLSSYDASIGGSEGFDEELEDSKSRFRGLMQRLLRRQAVRETSIAGSSGNISKSVRETGERKHHSELTEALLVERVLPDPEIVDVVQDVVEQLRAEFHDDSIAIVLLGSSGFGGRLVRKAFDNVGRDVEIDYALVTDNPVPSGLAEVIQGRVDELLSSFAKLHHGDNSPGYRSCSLNNAFYLHLENLSDIEGFVNSLIEELDQSYPAVEQGLIDFEELVPDLIDQLTIYFSPSVPPETNEDNARNALDMLSAIHAKRPEYWGEIVRSLRSKWEIQHKIKAKHILGSTPRAPIEVEMAQEIERVSGKAMSAEMVRMLERT